MLQLHSNHKPYKAVIQPMPSEAIPGQSVTVTEMVIRQEFNIPCSQRSLSMSYGSEGSPLIPRLNCDIFDAIDYSRASLRSKLADMEDKRNAAKSKQQETLSQQEANLVNATTETPK